MEETNNQHSEPFEDLENAFNENPFAEQRLPQNLDSDPFESSKYNL